ncbi:hypothetical protein EYC80_001280 [Monilinia laxa]|uniref:Uncharacterized protein n=1 Tax=Monilinia laxa TaxID=61186 RepID=A0A5N6K8Q7_MONLA|nr:hypothetical protein EYC80_001280 [Monilinia laxa]
MNFGILEVALATGKAAPAPGWAYVPDVTNSTPQIGLQPSSRRARGLGPNAGSRNVAGTGFSAHETTKKQDAKILRELQLLDRENHRDVGIAVVGRSAREGRGTQKLTPAVRKILASQKTFANHLSDYEALASLPSTSNTTSSQQAQGGTPAVSSPQLAPPSAGLTSTGKRSHKRKEPIPPSVEPPQATPAPKRSHKKKDPNAHIPPVSTPLRQSSTPALKPDPAISTPSFTPSSPPLSPSQTPPSRQRPPAHFSRPRLALPGGNPKIIGYARVELQRGERRLDG